MILSIGADAVAKAPPDGYTILITSVTSSHAANLFNFKKLPYDPIKDFTPVAMLQKSYFILMVRARGAVEDRGGADRGDEDEGRQGELRLWRAAGAGLRRALQGAQGPEGGRHPLQDLDGVAAGDVQRRDSISSSSTRPPARRCARAARCARSRSPPASACPASIFRPWPRPPTFRSSTSRRCGACCCRPERRAPIVAKLESWFAEISQMDATRQYHGQHPCGAVPRRRQGPGRLPPEGNQEVGGAGEAREDRAAVKPDVSVSSP